jgi:hypothetical protein
LGACGGLTHTEPGNVSSWVFTWRPSAGLRGTVTFSAAVAASYDNTFLAVACMLDASGFAATAPDDTTSTEHAGHMRRSRALQGATASLCPSSASSGSMVSGTRAAHGGMAMMHSTFFVQPTGWGSLLFSTAVISTPRQLAAAVVLSALFGAVTVVLGALMAPLERRAASDYVTPLQAIAGALATALHTGCHYLCMLLVMCFNAWIVLAVIGGHAVGVLLLAVLRRAALLPADRPAASVSSE